MTEVSIAYILVAVFCFLGHVVGVEQGHDEACKSVQSEWVKDKCMKVTREDLK